MRTVMNVINASKEAISRIEKKCVIEEDYEKKIDLREILDYGEDNKHRVYDSDHELAFITEGRDALDYMISLTKQINCEITFMYADERYVDCVGAYVINNGKIMQSFDEEGTSLRIKAALWFYVNDEAPKDILKNEMQLY